MRVYIAVIYGKQGIEVNRSDAFDDKSDAIVWARDECNGTDWRYEILSYRGLTKE